MKIRLNNIVYYLQYTLALYAVIIILYPISAEARQIPNISQCTAVSARTGAIVSAEQIVGPTSFVAEALWDMDGTPTIIYGRRYFSMPAFMQRWVSVHECGHLSWTSADEFAANCYALERLRPDGKLFNKIASFHRSMGDLSPQYGGNGSAFWRGTLAACGY